MKKAISNQLRRLSVILALLGMTLGILFPLNSVQRVSASEKTFATVEVQKPDAAMVEKKLGGVPVYFEENRGQQDKRVKYFTRGGGTEMFLTATEAVYVLRSQKSDVQSPKSEIENPLERIENLKSETENQKSTAVYMRLAGANEEANFAAAQPLEHKTNYFKGAESDWLTGISNFQRITAENIYEGVDIVWQGKEQGNVQYDFVVKPNADPKAIAWEIEGAENVSIDADGSLVIETELGVMKQSKPFTYQETEGVKSEVGSNWTVVNGQEQLANDKGQRTFRVQYDVSNYDSSKPLTIDPTVNLSNLAFSTFLGGAGDDRGNAIAVDTMGNTYVTGSTTSTIFPTTPGSFDTTRNGDSDIFVTKLSASGSALVYSTYLGGTFDEFGYGIAVDSAGNAYVTGYTISADYPTVGAFQPSFGGSSDVIVTKLNASGAALVYSTYLGGTIDEIGNGIAVDAASNAYITGYTTSANYPTVGAFQPSSGGFLDVIATKLNASGSALVYSTYLGGGGSDIGYGMAVDSVGNAYISGFTNSANYPTASAFQTAIAGGDDAVVTKLNASGSTLVYSTYLGGINSDSAAGVAVDTAGNAYVSGYTFSPNYPTTFDAFQSTYAGSGDGIVTKLNASGSTLVYSTYLGGSSFEIGNGIAVDTTGNAYVTGYTQSTNYPISSAFQSANAGNADAIVTKLNASGTSLINSTYLGGSNLDVGNGIAVDASGNAYITGFSKDGATDYPATNEAFQSNNNGGDDAFVTKLGDFSITGKVIDPTGSPLSNVMIAMSGQISSNMITGVDGRFAFTDTTQSNAHTITATRSGYSINPALFNIASLTNNREQFCNFAIRLHGTKRNTYLCRKRNIKNGYRYNYKRWRNRTK
jgi:hypothetical protein